MRFNRAFLIVSHRRCSLPTAQCPACRSTIARLGCMRKVCLACVPTFKACATCTYTRHTHMPYMPATQFLVHVRHALTCHPCPRVPQTHPKMGWLSLLPTPQKTATSQTCAFVRAFVCAFVCACARAYRQGVCACKRRRALCRASASNGVRVCYLKGGVCLASQMLARTTGRVHTHTHTHTHRICA